MAEETVKMTLKELQVISGAINEFLASKPSAKVSYRLSKLLKRLVAEQSHTNEERDKLFHKYGTIQDDGSLKLSKATIPLFNEELDALMAEEVEFPVMKIKLSELDGLGLTAGAVAHLLFMIEE